MFFTGCLCKTDFGFQFQTFWVDFCVPVGHFGLPFGGLVTVSSAMAQILTQFWDPFGGRAGLHVNFLTSFFDSCFLTAFGIRHGGRALGIRNPGEGTFGDPALKPHPITCRRHGGGYICMGMRVYVCMKLCVDTCIRVCMYVCM